MTEPDEESSAVAGEALAPSEGWRGDEHAIVVASAQEAGLSSTEAALDHMTDGFRRGMTLEDPLDGAIVFRGRTVLAHTELQRSLRPMFHYLSVPRESVRLAVDDGSFELRVLRDAAERAAPALDAAKLALQVWVGAGFVGLALLTWVGKGAAAIAWGIGLLLGAWQLRRGVVSGRSMLAARVALGLGMLARERNLILPPSGPNGSG